MDNKTRRRTAPPHIAKRHYWYGTARWKRLRKRVLASDPLCAICGKARATQCDHIEHRLDNATFWSWDNLRPACAECNNRLGATAARRHTGRKAAPLEGYPETATQGVSTAQGSNVRDIYGGRADLFSCLMTRAKEGSST